MDRTATRVAEAWYQGPADATPVQMHREDDAFRGLFIPGRMTLGQRFQAAIDKAVELGYDTSIVYVDSAEVDRYAGLMVAGGFTVRAWREPVREFGFVFRDARERPRVERPGDV